MRLRVVARPDRAVAELLVRLGLDLLSVPKLVAKSSGEKRVVNLKKPSNPALSLRELPNLG